MESTEADTDTLLVTELWIEPQFGFLRASADDAQRSPTRLDLFEQVRVAEFFSLLHDTFIALSN